MNRDVDRLDCRGLRAPQVLAQAIPLCMAAQSAGEQPHLRIENLGLLEDSVTRLLKAFHRLAEDYGARITLTDASGFSFAFLNAMSDHACLDLQAK